jgi:hypothetical protein
LVEAIPFQVRCLLIILSYFILLPYISSKVIAWISKHLKKATQKHKGMLHPQITNLVIFEAHLSPSLSTNLFFFKCENYIRDLLEQEIQKQKQYKSSGAIGETNKIFPINPSLLQKYKHLLIHELKTAC